MPRMGKREASGGVRRKVLRATETPCNSAANSLDPNASFDLDNVVVDKDLLTPQKVADHLSVQGEGGLCLVRNLPDSVMLHIFGYLPVKDLCRAACVCRGWNHLVRQKPLWKVVDLSPYKINLVNLRKLVFAYFTNSLRSLSLGGFLHSIKNTECISNSLLQELSTRSPNLQQFCLTGADLSKASSKNLPAKLERLKLISCNYPANWLAAAYQQSKFSSLHYLDMTGSNGFGSRDLKSFTPAFMKSLETLKLRGCYRVRAEDIIYIANNFTNLQVLDFGKLVLTNDALQRIGMSLTQLRTLNLRHCANSGNVQFDLLHLSPLRLLEDLDVTTLPAEPEDVHPPFNGDNLVGLVNTLPKLKVLLVSKNQNFTEDHVKKIKNGCVLPRDENDGGSVWRIGFFSRDKLNKIAEQQTR